MQTLKISESARRALAEHSPSDSKRYQEHFRAWQWCRQNGSGFTINQMMAELGWKYCRCRKLLHGFWSPWATLSGLKPQKGSGRPANVYTFAASEDLPPHIKRGADRGSRKDK